jgi:hypothetical protein
MLRSSSPVKDLGLSMNLFSKRVRSKRSPTRLARAGFQEKAKDTGSKNPFRASIQKRSRKGDWKSRPEHKSNGLGALVQAIPTGPVAQWLEHCADNAGVGSSIGARPDKKSGSPPGLSPGPLQWQNDGPAGKPERRLGHIGSSRQTFFEPGASALRRQRSIMQSYMDCTIDLPAHRF